MSADTGEKTATMSCEIITPRASVFSAAVTRARVQGAAGTFEILPGHEPVLSPLAISLAHFTTVDGHEQVFAVHGGFLDMDGEHITILADAAERALEIDLERARTALQRAKERLAAVSSADPHAVEIDIDRAKLAILRATMRMRAREAQDERPMG